jgi:hypothetical protein
MASLSLLALSQPIPSIIEPPCLNIEPHTTPFLGQCASVASKLAKLLKATLKLKRAIIITSSKIIAEGVNKLFDWLKDGFAQGLPGGMAKEDWILLHHNIKALEDKGIAVKVWNVKRELILQACLSAWNRFLDLENAPINQDPHKCVCWECLIKKQLNEMKYAKTGVLCCPCAHCMSLIAQNLKRGDKFVITNIAGVTEPTLTMEVDPGNTFRHASASSA